MAMDIDPFSMLEVSLQEDPDPDDRRHGSSASVMHQVENDVQVVQPPPPFQYLGNEVLTPQRAVLNNVQKLALTSKEEEKFRRRAYSSISLVLRKRLHCTICDAHIGAYLGLKEMDIEHPLLKVLACSKCTLKYHYLEFPLNLDGRDIRCRWCTESAKEESPLRFCSYCPFAFCEMCIYRNLPLDELASNKNSWMCFVCNVKDLWPSRAVLWALRVLIDTNLALKEDKKWSTDQSTCCKNKGAKQRRPVTLPPTVVAAAQNGHNQPPPLRPIAAASSNNFRGGLRNPIRPTHPRAVRPIMPIAPSRAVPISCQSSTTQLYDTAWLTEKVQSISTTLLNLNNNLHRIAQGIPEKENKYSIKSKMISMVSLLNISATQLQKASKEMEEESKKILDKNYKVAKVCPVSVPSTVTINPEPVKVMEPKVVLKPIAVDKAASKNTARKRRYSSNGRNKRFKGSSEFDSEYEDEEEEDLDDPDFLLRTHTAGEGPRTRLRTRACFVKLERLDESIVGDLKSESNEEFEPQPSTSKAPDPLGTLGPEELRIVSGNGECGGVQVKEEHEEPEKMAADDTSQPVGVEAREEVSQPAGPEGAEDVASQPVGAEARDEVSQPVGSEARDEVSQPVGPEAADDVASQAANDTDPRPTLEKAASNASLGSDVDASRPAAAEPPQDSPKNPCPDDADDSSCPDKGSDHYSESHPAAEENPSQTAGADENETRSLAVSESDPAAEDSGSSHQQDPEPGGDDTGSRSSLSNMNASGPSLNPSRESINDPPLTTAADEETDLNEAPGDNPLNESSATDSSITDSSTTSADTSDS